MLRSLYLSPLGYLISFILNIVGIVFHPFMVYGYWNRVSGKFRRFTRISSTALILNKNQFDIGDNCWIWHHSIIDSSNGVKIGEGVQIGAWVGIFSHSSHVAIRLHGRHYIEVDKNERVGYVRGAVEIGDYSFIGASAIIFPGVKIGRGCVIAAGAVVNKDIPDFSIASGNPAKIIGKTSDLDQNYFDKQIVRDQYFDRQVVDSYLAENESKK